jgi:hypothetical protein
MAQEKREGAGKKSDIGVGPYLAKVVSHLDPSFMGGLEVTLLREDGNSIGDNSQTYPVYYAPPFYGNTAFEYQGFNTSDFNDTQKSYGMWFTPPDVGVTVLVVFVDGNPGKGYWIACVPGRFMNHMIPAIGASDSVDFAEGDADKYDTGVLPVAEINRRANDLGESLEIEKIPRAVHPIADRYLEQGTLEDDVRGSTTSTSRRGIPNLVFGISTPGPLDRRDGAKKAFIGKTQSQSPTPVPVSRLGGSQFVMDDGDDRYQRMTPASDGPMEYGDTLNGESGEPTIPKDEYLRLRTRTGHQILMHNSEDLIYIGNARGTTWIELTSNGKIDIFAEDSVSIHTKQDFNLYADRDINMEAGRNINMKSAERFQMDVEGDWNLVVTGNGSIAIGGDYNTDVVGSTFLSTAGDYNVNTAGNTAITSGGDGDINIGGDMKMTSGGDASLGGANITMSGGAINLNGPAAPDAAEAAPATPPEALSTHENQIVDPNAADWVGDRYDPGDTLTSIIARIPMHEPWQYHEHLDPTAVTPDITDREA